MCLTTVVLQTTQYRGFQCWKSLTISVLLMGVEHHRLLSWVYVSVSTACGATILNEMHTEDWSSAAGPTSTSSVEGPTHLLPTPKQIQIEWIETSYYCVSMCHKASLESHGNTLTSFLSKGGLKCMLSPGGKSEGGKSKRSQQTDYRTYMLILKR